MLLQVLIRTDMKTRAKSQMTSVAATSPILKNVGARKAISIDIGRIMRTIAKVPKSAVLKVLFAASISPFCRSMVKNLETELLTELIRSVT